MSLPSVWEPADLHSRADILDALDSLDNSYESGLIGMGRWEDTRDEVLHRADQLGVRLTDDEILGPEMVP